MRKEKSSYIIWKVIQALDILEQFGDGVDELSLTELSKRLAIKEESVLQLLATLKSRYYIEQDSLSEKYRLGFKNLELAHTVLRQTDLYRVSRPVLASIAASCGEKTAVAVLRKHNVVELDSIQSEHPVQVISRVGDHLPVHCTAAGKVLLAAQGSVGLAGLLQGTGLKRWTPATITDPEQLRLALAQVLEQGYAVEDRELDQDVRAVAAPIRDYLGAVVGAVVVTGPSCRIDQERISAELAELVRQGARDISLHLGFDASSARQALRELPDSPPTPLRPRKGARPAPHRKQKYDSP